MTSDVHVLRDVARGAVCVQSSADPKAPWAWADPNRAVRGAKTGECSFRTDLEDCPWWEADLRDVFQVEAVAVYNFDTVALDPSMSAGELREGARFLRLFVQDPEGEWTLAYDHGHHGGAVFGGVSFGPLVIQLAGRHAKRIRIELGARRHLNLDAVEVFVGQTLDRAEAAREILAAANNHNFEIARTNFERSGLSVGELALLASPASFSLNDRGLDFVTQLFVARGDEATAERLADEYAAQDIHAASFDERMIRREISAGRSASASARLRWLARAHPNHIGLTALEAGIRELKGNDSLRPVKMIIWDLDDTLWTGTLAEGDDVRLNESRAAIVRAAPERGVICSVASKNERSRAMERLRAFGLDALFILPWFGFQPKGPGVAALIREMQLRSQDCLLVDDNPLNLEEARAFNRGLGVLDANGPGADDALRAILAAAKPDGGKRFREYQALEKKAHAFTEYQGDSEAFLRTCAIRVAIVEDARNVAFAERIEELVNRSNQLNYTHSRIPKGTAGYLVGAVLEYDCRTVFVCDRFGAHGLVGFAAFNRATREFEHFVFSCRIMNMGIESAVMSRFQRSFPDVRPLVDAALPDYIEIVDHRDPAFQPDFLNAGKSEADIRVMANCQSGILIHYLGMNDRCEPDAWPDVFSLQRGDPLSVGNRAAYRYRVLAMSSQYAGQAWDSFDVDLFRQALRSRFAEWESDDAVSFVLLSPDCDVVALEDSVGRRWTHAELNAIVRETVRDRQAIQRVELGDYVRGSSDVSDDARHYGRALLLRVAGVIRGAIDADDRRREAGRIQGFA